MEEEPRWTACAACTAEDEVTRGAIVCECSSRVFIHTVT